MNVCVRVYLRKLSTIGKGEEEACFLQKSAREFRQGFGFYI